MWKNLFIVIVLLLALFFGKNQVMAADTCCDEKTPCPAPATCTKDVGSLICDSRKACETAVNSACLYISNNASDPERANCEKCVGAWTAFGCIETGAGSSFFAKLLTIGIGIAGGIAFLMILFGGFQILISAGNPEQMNTGKEIISSAIAGLLLIVFSVFLLRLIGYDILRIPGFQP
jgi:hypothetical protein